MEINKFENNIEIVVPVTKYYGHIFVFGLTSIIMIPSIIIIIIILIKAVFTLNFNFPEQLYGYLIFGLPFATYSLWLLIGKEKILIKNDIIEITKTNGILTFRKSYDIKKIKNIETIKKKYKSDSFIDTKRENIREIRKAFPFWINMGKIKFQYENKNISIFNGLNNSEMIEVCEILKSEVEKRNK